MSNQMKVQVNGQQLEAHEVVISLGDEHYSLSVSVTNGLLINYAGKCLGDGLIVHPCVSNVIMLNGDK